MLLGLSVVQELEAVNFLKSLMMIMFPAVQQKSMEERCMSGVVQKA